MSAPAPPPPRNPALRVKLPCDDEKDFFARYADTVAEKGLKVPTANLRPVGSRVRVVLEFRNAQTVTGEGVIDAHVEGARPAMNVRVLKFERSTAGGPALTPAPMPAITPAPLPTPLPARPGTAGSPATASVTAKASASPIAKPTAPAKSTATPTPTPTATATPTAAPRPPAEGTGELEPLYEDAPGSAASTAPEPTPEPAPLPQAAVSRATAVHVHPASRRAAVVAVAAGAVLLVGLAGYAVVARRPAPGPAAPGAAGAAASAPTDVAARVATADRRLADGRLAGPDGALEHLLAAKALAPGDAGVERRLALLADTLERLGSRALERGDAAEARVHLTAALQAAPERSSVAAKLEALAKASPP